jgi:hypothetical protein
LRQREIDEHDPPSNDLGPQRSEDERQQHAGQGSLPHKRQIEHRHLVACLPPPSASANRATSVSKSAT